MTHVRRRTELGASTEATGAAAVGDCPRVENRRQHGHDHTRRPHVRLDADRARRWVDELVDATCPSPPALVGHLLGGAIAARYAVQHGERLSHLVLVDTLGLAWFRPAPSFALPMVRFVARPTERSRDRLFRQYFLDFDDVGARFGDHWDDLRAYALDRARDPGVQAAVRTLLARSAWHRYPPTT
jgi:pimeloyl-ACP methyl ester carboxylesterase